MGIALFSSLGLPGLNGFVGEFLIFRGVFPLAWVAATVSILGLLVTAAVILTVIQKVFSGPTPEHCASFPDIAVYRSRRQQPAADTLGFSPLDGPVAAEFGRGDGMRSSVVCACWRVVFGPARGRRLVGGASSHSPTCNLPRDAVWLWP